MSHRRSLRLPIILAVVMILILIILTIGWVVLTVVGALANTRFAGLHWTLLSVGTVFIATLLAGVIVYLVFSIKTINFNQRQANFLDSVTHEFKSLVDRGIDCIVQCQIVVDGALTVWCAQHDEITLAPAKARSYELPSLSGAESAGIVTFLMSVDKPTPEVVRAVKGAVAWFESAKIEGYRYRKSSQGPGLIKDAAAGPLWARFYEIQSNRPIFCDRDGVVKYNLDEIGDERRGGYTWYGNWGGRVAKEYAKWPHR